MLWRLKITLSTNVIGMNYGDAYTLPVGFLGNLFRRIAATHAAFGITPWKYQGCQRKTSDGREQPSQCERSISFIAVFVWFIHQRRSPTYVRPIDGNRGDVPCALHARRGWIVMESQNARDDDEPK